MSHVSDERLECEQLPHAARGALRLRLVEIRPGLEAIRVRRRVPHAHQQTTRLILGSVEHADATTVDELERAHADRMLAGWPRQGRHWKHDRRQRCGYG